MNYQKIAVVILAYADFESLEITLAAHSKFLPQNVNFYILQNGRGSYDCERTYKVAQRYASLFPEQITVVDWIKPQAPYLAIRELLNSKEMEKYDYICKMDDDTFPLTKDWFDKLCECYEKSYNKYGENLGYVSTLVNNNPWGFKRVLEKMNLTQEFFDKYSRNHYVGWRGADETAPYKMVTKDEIYDGGGGTVWGNAYISRWVHKKTTLNPDMFINAVQNAGFEEIDNTKRYSINCMLFKKDFWNAINIGDKDDEHQTVHYCKKHNKKIIANLEIPMVHLFFFTQRDENKDLIPVIRNYYEQWLNLVYPISLCPSKEYENENRLKFIEQHITKLVTQKRPKLSKTKHWYENLFSIRNLYEQNIKKKQIIILGFKITYKLKERS